MPATVLTEAALAEYLGDERPAVEGNIVLGLGVAVLIMTPVYVGLGWLIAGWL